MTLQERDREVIWHPFTQAKTALSPIPIVSGEGVYLIDEDGNKYIDAISSWWVNIHGHAHPYIAGKLFEQAKKLEHVIFAGFTHEPAIILAERLIPLLPGKFSKVFYTDNGSTATEVAIKISLQYWWNVNMNEEKQARERNRVLALYDSYHGDTFGAMSISERSVFTLPFQDKLFEVVFIDINDPELDSLHPEEFACFIYEPLLQAAGGMKIHVAVLLNKILSWCRNNEIICIADEVMTGFGRTGNLFASFECATTPDIICLSKGLTGGTMALGVTAVNAKIADAFVSEEKMKTLFHGHSFTANPLACTAALASLDLLEADDCQENIRRIVRASKDFAAQLSSYASVKNARCIGTVVAFEIVSGEDGYLNNLSSNITSAALKLGVYIRPLGNTVYTMPPYCITDEQLQIVFNCILELLKK